MDSENNISETEASAPAKRRKSIKRSLSILVAGRAEATVDTVIARLSNDRHFDVAKRMITNGHADPLHNVENYPDALVFVLSGGWEDELLSLGARPAESRPPSLIIGMEDNPQAMRLAMRAGAREFLKWPDQIEEMKSALALIASECQLEEQIRRASITSIMNAKGGSGGTFVATSLAHIFAARDNFHTALLDLDLQFSGLTSYFDLQLKHGLLEVLEAISEMDTLALSGYMTKHESGLELLGNKESVVGVSEEVEQDQFFSLLELLSVTYERVVIDLPRHFDYMTIQTLESSDKIMIIVQQNVSSLKDAMRLLAILRNDLAIAKDKILIVINRYDKNSDITLKDIQNALCVEAVMKIANDYDTVSESLNTGIPVYESAKASRVAKSIVKISDVLEGRKEARETGFVHSAISGIRQMLDHHKKDG